MDTITVPSGTTNLSLGGQSYTAIIGSNNSGAIDGVGVTVVVNGNSNALTSAVNGGTLTLSGSNNTITTSGENITATFLIGSIDDILTINAQYITADVEGTSDDLQVNGQNATIALAGSNNTVNTAGNQIILLDGAMGAAIQGGGNSDVIGSGVSATITSFGGDTVLVSGNTALLDISDSYADVTVSGSNNVLRSVDGSHNTIAISGNGNDVSALGADDVVSVAGQGQFLAANSSTITAASGTTLTLFNTPTAYQASNGNIINLGVNAGLSVQGGNNWVNATGGDTVTFAGYPYGAGDGIGGSGAGNNVTFQQDGYALLSQSTITFNGNEGAAGIIPIHGQVTGDGNTITATPGATLSVAGTGNMITASGTAIALAGPPQIQGTPLGVRGFAFPSYTSGDFNTTTSTASLAAMQSTGANAVEIVFSQYLYDPGLPDQDAYTINASVPQRTAADGATLPAAQSVSDADLIAQIRQAESDGLQVLLDPHIDPADGTWRALQTPQNIPAFFANYQNFIVHYAQIAQQTGVQTFSIGCELQSLTGQQYLPYWTQIIQAVRQVYSGQLTYASATYEIGTVSFWQQLDIIGTDAYERTSSQLNPTEAQLQAGWTQPLPVTVNPIPSEGSIKTEGFYDSNGVAISPIAEYESMAAQYDKPILITEAGYASVNETDLLEGDDNRNSTTSVNYQQQADAYQALLSALSENNSILPGQSGQWLDGAYLWAWSPNPASVTADDLSVQGKPALSVVQRAFEAASGASGAANNTILGNGNAISVADAAGASALAINGTADTLDISWAGGTSIGISSDQSGDLILALRGGAQILQIDSQLIDAEHGVDSVAIADGIALTRSELSAFAKDYQLASGGHYTALSGTAGDGGTIAITAGNVVALGTPGHDRVSFISLGKSAITIIPQSDGTTLVSTAGGQDVLVGIQNADTVDGTTSFDPTSIVAQIARLYDTAFGRSADPAGMHNWSMAMKSGLSLTTVADAFVTSAEYTTRYPNADDATFVEQLYQNTLHRASDPAGKAAWIADLANGMSRGAVMVGFSESPEHQALTENTVKAGIWDLDENAAEVARLYDAALGRLPDAAGLGGWTNAIEHGSYTLQNVADGFLASPEGQSIYGQLSNSEFIEKLYNTALHRSPDPIGKEDYEYALDNNQITRGAMVVTFSESAEHKALTAPNILNSNNGITMI